MSKMRQKPFLADGGLDAEVIASMEKQIAKLDKEMGINQPPPNRKIRRRADAIARKKPVKDVEVIDVLERMLR